MPHLHAHPKSGKYFRISLPGTLEAVYDRLLQGKSIRLNDWADRIDQEHALTKKQIEAVLSFYAHRCLPDLDPAAKVALSMMGDAVYATLLEPEGIYIAVVRDTELIESPDKAAD